VRRHPWRGFLGRQDGGRDLLVGGEPPALQLGIDALPVDADLEGAATRLDQFDGDVPEGLLQFGSQTGCLREVVSLDAVFDADLHGDSVSKVPEGVRRDDADG